MIACAASRTMMSTIVGVILCLDVHAGARPIGNRRRHIVRRRSGRRRTRCWGASLRLVVRAMVGVTATLIGRFDCGGCCVVAMRVAIETAVADQFHQASRRHHDRIEADTHGTRGHVSGGSGNAVFSTQAALDSGGAAGSQEIIHVPNDGFHSDLHYPITMWSPCCPSAERTPEPSRRSGDIRRRSAPACRLLHAAPSASRQRPGWGTSPA